MEPRQSEAFSTIVTASTRLARELRYEYDCGQIASGNQTWSAADILPFRSWLERCWREWMYSGVADEPTRLLRASEERTIWAEIVRNSGNDLLQVEATADAVLEAWNLLWSWELPLDASEWEDSEDTEVFRSWSLEFQARCADGNWLSSALLPQFVQARMEDGSLPAPPALVVAGFSEMTSVERSLFGAIERQGSRVEVRQPPVAVACTHAVRYGALDRAGEIRAAADWARRLLEETPRGSTGPPIGIVVPDLSVYRGEVERIFDEVLHSSSWLDPYGNARRAFNISLGPALGEYPLVRGAFLILGLNPCSVPSEDVGRLLRSPFTAGGSAEFSHRSLLDRELRRFGEEEISVEMILQRARQAGPYCAPVLAKCLERWRTEWEQLPPEQSPSGWASSFASLLDVMGWPGDRTLDSTEFQTVSAWRAILAELASLDDVTRRLNLSDALVALDRLARTRLFQPESERAPIQILGLLEASGLRFEHAWIMGMHDGAWPRSTGPNPFLPARLQRRMNLPQSSPQRELEFAELLTLQLLASAPSVIVSYPCREGDAALRHSPLVTGLREIDWSDLGSNGSVGFLEQLRASGRMETVDDHQGPAWEGVLARGGTAVFEQQAACPFRAFAIVRLGAEQLQQPVPGLGPADRGNLVHSVLEKIWTRLESHEGLQTMPPGQLSALISETVEMTLEAMSARKRVLRKPRFRSIEQARLERLVRDWLEIERDRQPFRVLEREAERALSIGGVEVAVRVDRLDGLDDGTCVVVDYKTGEHRTTEWAGPRPDQPQLPLYATTLGSKLSGVLFGILKTGKIGFRGLTATDGIVPGVRPGGHDHPLEETAEEWHSTLERIGRDFRQGNAAVDPKDARKTCQHCHLTSLCRIEEAANEYNRPRRRTAHA